MSQRRQGAATFVADALVIAGVTALAIAGRDRVGLFAEDHLAAHTALVISPFVAAVWLTMSVLLGTYGRRVLGAGTLEYRRVFTAAASTAGLVGITCYLAKYPLSRGFYLGLFVIGTPMLLLERYGLRRLTHSARRRGHLITRVLLVGSPIHVDQVAAVLRREAWLGYRTVGALVPGVVASTPAGLPVAGDPDDLLAAVRRFRIDTVIFAEGAFPDTGEFRRVAWELEEHNIQMIVVPGLTDVAAERVQMRPIGGLPLVYVEQPRSAAAASKLKRAFDISAAIAVLAVAWPLLALVAVWIKLSDGGPVLYRQVRVGRDRKLFRCLKFRSMVVDADQHVASLEHLNETDGAFFKMAQDPRVTRVGRIIRRYSIDELPQLFNVIVGDMSLVGPRPAQPIEVARFDEDMLRRQRVRPGMTGLWQVSGRADLSWEDAVRLDLYYVDNWSSTQDIAILARTMRAVLRSRGAY